MPGPDKPPELDADAFDRELAMLGIVLEPAERANALRLARDLHGAALRLRAGIPPDPARP